METFKIKHQKTISYISIFLAISMMLEIAFFAVSTLQQEKQGINSYPIRYIIFRNKNITFLEFAIGSLMIEKIWKCKYELADKR